MILNLNEWIKSISDFIGDQLNVINISKSWPLRQEKENWLRNKMKAFGVVTVHRSIKGWNEPESAIM